MHSVDVEPEPQDVLLELGLLITEGRKPTKSCKGFEEGPHCLRQMQKAPRNHTCTVQNHLCVREESFRKHVEVLWRNNVPLCIEVLLCADCPCGRDKAVSPEVSPLADSAYVLLEQWTITSYSKRAVDSSRAPSPGITNGRSILHAVRSFLHFSQLSAWLALSKGENPKYIMYRVTIPGENFASKFTQLPQDHEFPTVHFKNHVLKVNVKSLPRLGNVPATSCSNAICTTRSQVKRSQSPPIGEIIRGGSPRPTMSGRLSNRHILLTSSNNRWKIKHNRMDIRNAVNQRECTYTQDLEEQSSPDSDYVDKVDDIPKDSEEDDIAKDSEDEMKPRKSRTRPIPTLSEKIDFLKSLDTAATRLFHRKTGLPLTSSPAPLRKGQDRFDFDSSLVSASRITSRFRRGCHPPRFSEATRALLGPFEESVLNGRIEPVSTVQGFTAEIGASGSFCPRHIHLPVTVFFYTFCDNDKISTPYLAHVDLGEQGYCVPRNGTVQVTLFNPLRTVIKMFVVQFNLENMPNNSQTFLRQRTYFMPLGESDSHPNAQKWLRYLIHLRFASNNTGQIFLHTDIRMVIFRKSDADTATGFDIAPHELRSFTYAPHNPKFSPRFLGPIETDTKEIQINDKIKKVKNFNEKSSKNAHDEINESEIQVSAPSLKIPEKNRPFLLTN